MGKLESEFQSRFIDAIKKRYPGAMCLKNDANYIQGIPDWTVLFGERYAVLEIKKDADAPARPNQPYYVELFGKMAYSAFVYPENADMILAELDVHFGVTR